MGYSHKQIRLKGVQLTNTAKSVQWKFINPNTKLEQIDWIPYSHIDEIHPTEIVITDWIARKIGAI